MTQTLTPKHAVYTPQEVATALRVSSETIRRKILAGELHALEVGGKARKQYRIFSSDLIEWLGQERASKLFGLDGVAQEIRTAWGGVSDAELHEGLEEAVAHARAARPTPEGPFLPTPTPEELAEWATGSRVKKGVTH